MESRLPFLLLILPWVAAVAALVVARWRRVSAAAGLVGVAALAALVVLAISLPGDPATTIFGRTLTLTPLARGLLLLIYGLVGLAASAEPLPAGIGLLVFLAGFVLLYRLVDPSLVMVVALIILQLTVTLVVAYLAQARRQPQAARE